MLLDKDDQKVPKKDFVKAIANSKPKEIWVLEDIGAKSLTNIGSRIKKLIATDKSATIVVIRH